MSLLFKKHARYFQLCAATLPEKAQAEDANKLALIYFVLTGLDLVGQLPRDEYAQYTELVYQHMILLPDKTMQGFRSSQTFRLDEQNNAYDLPNLSATFFGLAVLLALESDFSARIDRHKVMRFVSRCQITLGPDKGCFRPVSGSAGDPFGEADLRLCYIAAGIRTMLGYDKLAAEERVCDIDVAALTAFILGKVNYTGGLANAAFTESHSGLTFCGLAALQLLGFDMQSEPKLMESTRSWLVHRQVQYPDVLYADADYEYYDDDDTGGFNGRENKLGDTCYSWWVVGLLDVLDSTDGVRLVDLHKAAAYLLERTQHPLMGGFGKSPLAFPDPFHSFMGLASLALLKEKGGVSFEGDDQLAEIDLALVISRRLRDFMETLWK